MSDLIENLIGSNTQDDVRENLYRLIKPKKDKLILYCLNI